MPTKYKSITPRANLTAVLSLDRYNEITALAESLGIVRHRLLLAAIEIGIPLATEQFRRQAAQRPRVKE